MKHIFLLGSNPELSLAELKAVFPGVEFAHLLSTIVVANLPEEITSKFASAVMIAKLGGTVKILTVIQEDLGEQKNAAELSRIIIAHFAGRTQRVKLALAEIGRDHLPKIQPREIKDGLEAQGIPVRYYGDSRQGLSAAVWLHKKGIEELHVIQAKNGQLWLAQTAAMQDIDTWTLRDRAKPYADRQKGMLPPKLARIMVNLALGERIWKSPVENADLTLYDPFCGTGTVLLEAAESGFRLAASDLDVKAVLGTQENLAWWAEESGTSNQVFATTQDVTQVKLSQIGERQLNFIVTEPFLGKQTPNPAQLDGIFRGLEKLYWGAFRQWTTLLAPQAKIVMVWPLVIPAAGKRPYHLESLIDKIKKLGYTASSKQLVYGRPGAIVHRQIWCFEYQPVTNN